MQQARHHHKQRRLSTAAGPDQDKKLAWLYLKGNLVDRQRAAPFPIAIVHGNVAHLNCRGPCCYRVFTHSVDLQCPNLFSSARSDSLNKIAAQDTITTPARSCGSI